MSIKSFLLFTGIFFSFHLFGQKEISIRKTTVCDTTDQSGKSVKVKMEKVRCIKYSGKSQALYFKTKDEFQQYLEENKMLNGGCADLPETEFNFKKFDVVMFRISTGAYWDENSYQVKEVNGNYTISLNLYYREKPIEKPGDEKTEYTINLVLRHYSRYMLLPKIKKGIPEFQVFETSYKCY